MGWTVSKIDHDLLPIMKRYNETKIQKTIENFFTVDVVPTFAKQSTRMKTAIRQFKTKTISAEVIASTMAAVANSADFNLSEDEENKTEKNFTKTTEPTRRPARAVRKGKKPIADQEEDSDVQEIEPEEAPPEVASAKKTTKRKSSETTKKGPKSKQKK